MENPTIIYMGYVYKGLKEVISNFNSKGYEVKYLDELNENEKNPALNGAKYLLIGSDSINKDILSKAKNTALIQATGVGSDNIDIKYANEKGISVANAPRSNSVAVAELTIALILSLYRKISYLDHSTKNGEWHMWDLRHDSFELQGKTHGIIGFGDVGKEVAARSNAFGTKIYYYDVFKADKETEEKLNATYLPFKELLENSDVISVHVPLIDDTRNLIGEKEFKIMKKNAIIINVARGGIVNEKDLYEALSSNTIAGAAFDVWEEEPVSHKNPLLNLNNVLATPHVAGATIDTMNRIYEICFDNINRFEQGEKVENIINL